MAEDCFKKLELINGKVANELGRLDRLRERWLRSTVIESTLIPFPSLDTKVTWGNQIELRMVGSAAAKSNPWTVEFCDESGQIVFRRQLLSKCVVAHLNRWLMPDIGCCSPRKEIQSSTATWLPFVMSTGPTTCDVYGRTVVYGCCNQSIRCCQARASLLGSALAGIRKIVGVLYRPTGSAIPKAGRFAEWLPCASLNADMKSKRAGP